MLAYSSIEHIGLTSIGLALGPLGSFASLLHLMNHGLPKSLVFFFAGRVHERYQTNELERVTGLGKVMPGTGTFFALALGAIMGLPPLGLFISEMALLRAGFAAGRSAAHTSSPHERLFGPEGSAEPSVRASSRAVPDGPRQ
jgi:hydrogenase-4 component F